MDHILCIGGGRISGSKLSMKIKSFIGIVSLFTLGCSPKVSPVEDRIRMCWENINDIDGHIKADKIKLIYLRGLAVIAPSVKCDGIRMQATEYSSVSLKQLKVIDYGDYQYPLGLSASVSFDVIDHPVKHVIEIRLLSISSYVSLDHAQSVNLERRIRLR